MYLKEEYKFAKFEHDVIVAKDGMIAEIPFVKLFQIFGGSLNFVLEKNKTSHEVSHLTFSNSAD